MTGRQVWTDSDGRRSFIRPDGRGVVEITIEALAGLMTSAGLTRDESDPEDDYRPEHQTEASDR